MSTASERASRAMQAATVWDNTFPFGPVCGSHAAHVRTLERMRGAGYNCVSLTTASDIDDMPSAIRKIAHDLAFFRETEDRYLVARTAEDIGRAKREGRLAVVFTFQGTLPFERDAGLVELFYRLGVRQALMAYNQRNNVADGCHEPADAGLSRFGVEVVREMERVGMLVDCTHTGYRTTMDVLEMATRPVVFSHSNARALCDHERNIGDDQAKACARTGGVVGVNGLGLFLGSGATPGDMFRHVDHWVSLIGSEHVGFALDYVSDPGALLGVVASKAAKYPAGQYAMTDLPMVQPEQVAELVELMLAHGYPDSSVSGVLGGNWLRVAGAVWR